MNQYQPQPQPQQPIQPQMQPAPQPMQPMQPAPQPAQYQQPAPVQADPYAPQAQQSTVDPYAAADTTEVSGHRNPYPREGEYLYLVNGVREKRKDPAQTQKRHTVSVIIDLTVIHVMDPGSIHPEGTSVSVVYSDSSPFFLSDLKKFVGACHGMDPNTVGGQMLKDAFGDQQPCAGTVLSARVVKGEKKNSPGQFWEAAVWSGAVSPEHVTSLITPEAQARFFPGGIPVAAQATQPAPMAAPVQMAPPLPGPQ